MGRPLGSPPFTFIKRLLGYPIYVSVPVLTILIVFGIVAKILGQPVSIGMLLGLLSTFLFNPLKLIAMPVRDEAVVKAGG